jgi:ligand-binding SRPBCC domain-containing protein
MVEAPIEQVYDFHMDSHNLDEILPPWLDITPISVPVEMKVGAEIHYKVKRFGISMPFIIRINRLVVFKILCQHQVIPKIVS